MQLTRKGDSKSETFPDLSVIVTIVDGEPALTRCLEALCKQVDPPPLEIIVPYDDTIHQVARLAEHFPTARFLFLGSLSKSGLPGNAFAQHDLYDRRRAGGLRAARGRLLAMLEDRGTPRSDWARSMFELHDGTSCAAVGGAIENGSDTPLGWAVFFCDFGRYQSPLQLCDAEYLSDVNICYKRDALESVRKLWEEKYQEPAVNWALRRQGRRLILSGRPIVIEAREQTSLRSLLAERIHWGRVFGQIRGRATTPFRNVLWAAATPLLPALLFVRHLQRQLEKRRNVPDFIRATPAILVLLVFWTIGELIGYCEAGIELLKSSPRRKASA